MRWRWDQGRLEYFRFDNLVRIAETLAALDGVALNGSFDPLRAPLVSQTGLAFKPDAHFRQAKRLQVLNRRFRAAPFRDGAAGSR